MTYDKNESHKKVGLYSVPKKYIFVKTTGAGGDKLTHRQPFWV